MSQRRRLVELLAAEHLELELARIVDAPASLICATAEAAGSTAAPQTEHVNRLEGTTMNASHNNPGP